LVAVTVPDLKLNPQDTSAFYLQNIYQLLADPNVSRPSIPDAPVKPLPFSPPKYVIWVNSLWFLSLTISLTCALLATLLQQWARRYHLITQRPQCSPHNGARIRAFFAHGVEKFFFSWVVEMIPALIHLSLFLFFAGLLIYLFNIHQTVFCPVAVWIALSVAAYLVITFMPILWLDSPYFAPLSALVFWISGQILSRLSADYYKRSFQGIEKTAINVVHKLSSKLDGFILKWTFDAHALVSDDQLGQFFKSILGFCSSIRIAEHPERYLATLDSGEFSSVLVGFLNRTLTSKSVPDPDKIEQFLTCVKVADAIHGKALRGLFSVAAASDLVRTVAVGHSLRSRDNRGDQEIGLCAQTIVADIIANDQGRDDSWTALAADQLGKSKADIQRYLADGNDNILLANWIHMARQISNSSSGIDEDMAGDAAWCILQPPSEFDIQNTLPELRHDLCVLWDEIVPKAQNTRDGSVPHFIIFLIRRLHFGLHLRNASFDKFRVSSYPLCGNPRHRRETADTPADTLASPGLNDVPVPS
jgi:Family of unknown function (DUF6535)